jgi:hypothetical protein
MGYYQCQIEGVHVPLCTLIDYRGFRLIAMSILPLYYGGLVYGTPQHRPPAPPPPPCRMINHDNGPDRDAHTRVRVMRHQAPMTGDCPSTPTIR